MRELHGTSLSKSLRAGLDQITCGSEEKKAVELLKAMDCQTTTTTTRPAPTSYILEDEPARKQVNASGASMQLSSQQSKPSAQQSPGSGPVLLPANNPSSSCALSFSALAILLNYCVLLLIVWQY